MQIWVIFRYIECFEKQKIEDFKSILKTFCIGYNLFKKIIFNHL